MDFPVVRRLLCLLWCCGLAITLSADPAWSAALPPSSGSQDGLEVLDGAGTEVLGQTTARYSFGTRSALDLSPIEHTFDLQVTSKASLVIDRITTTCECTSAFIEGDHTGHMPMVLTARQRLRLHVSIDPTQAAHGQLRNAALLFVRGNSEPSVTLEMTGTIRPPVSFSQPVLDFGTVPAGTASSLTITARLDSRLLTSGKLPRLTSSNLDVQIRLMKIAPPAAMLSHRNSVEAEDRLTQGGALASQGADVLQTYEVSLSKSACLGLIDATVSILASDTEAFDPPAPALGSLSILGEVAGELSSYPRLIVFSGVTTGRSAKQQVILTSASPETLQGLVVTCENTFLSARLAAAVNKTYDPDTQRQLVVTVGADAPVGRFQSHVLITTVKGERLKLPVLAVVEAAPYR